SDRARAGEDVPQLAVHFPGSGWPRCGEVTASHALGRPVVAREHTRVDQRARARAALERLRAWAADSAGSLRGPDTRDRGHAAADLRIYRGGVRTADALVARARR